MNSNYQLPKKNLEILIKNKIYINWIQISTLAVYEYCFDNYKLINDRHITNPILLYGTTKNKFDEYLIKQSNLKLLNYIIIRPGSIIYDNEKKVIARINLIVKYIYLNKYSYFHYIYASDLSKILSFLVHTSSTNLILLANNNLNLHELQNKKKITFKIISLNFFKIIQKFEFGIKILRLTSLGNFYENSQIIKKNFILKKINI